MATVPRAELQVATQPARPVFGNPNAASGAFGTPLADVAQAGQQLSQVADSLIDAQLRIQERNDAVARARDFLPFQSFGRESLTALQTTDDISNPATVQKYRQSLDDKMAEILGAHQGSAASRAQLETRLLEQKLEFMDTAAVASTTAGRQAVQDRLGVDLGGIAARVAADPTQFTAELDNWNKSLDDMRSVLTPEEERQWERQGPAVMTEAIIDGMLTQPNGDIEVQRLISATPGLMALMEPAQQASVRKRIQAVAQANAAERNKTYTLGRDQVLFDSAGNIIARGPVSPPPRTKSDDVAEAVGLAQKLGLEVTPDMLSHVLGFGDIKETLTQKVDEFERIYAERNGGTPPPREITMDFIGVNAPEKTIEQTISELQAVRAKLGQPALTDEQLNVIQGIGKSDKTFAEKVTEIEAVTGPLEPEQLQKLGGVLVTKQDKGFKFDNDNLQVFAELAPRYGAGETTPEEDRIFEAAVTDYIQKAAPTQDPTTGNLIEGRRKELPEYVRRAAEARGLKLPTDEVDPLAPPSQQQPGAGQQPQGQPGDQGAAQPGTQAPAAQQQAQAGRPGPTVEAAAQLPQQQTAQPAAASQEVRRLQPGEFRQNADGSRSTERSLTVTEQALNQGKPTNIPSIWMVDGQVQEVDQDTAVRYALESGEQFPSFNTIPEAEAAAKARSDAGGRFADQQRQPTLYEQAPLLTGPVSTIGAAAGELPVPGLAGQFGQERTAQSSFALAQQELISAIRDARYYNPTEQKDLEQEINIKGGAATSANAFRQRLVGIDQALERRQANALKAIQSERTTRDERRKAIEVFNAIENFRAILLPPIVETPDQEALFLRDNPGATYLTPDGKGGYDMRRDPGAADGE